MSLYAYLCDFRPLRSENTGVNLRHLGQRGGEHMAFFLAEQADDIIGTNRRIPAISSLGSGSGCRRHPPKDNEAESFLARTTTCNKDGGRTQVRLLTAGAAALGIHLDQAQCAQFRRYYQELVDWNTRVNLTSVTGLEEVQTRHFLDSLTVALAIPQSMPTSARFLDIGSGGGFPGMPLKIVFPALMATLIDSTSKKTAFLVHLREVLGLRDVEICTGRAESLAHQPELRGTFDFVFARAVGSLRVLAELALPFCQPGGMVIAQKNLNNDDEIERAQRAVETMGGVLKEVKEVPLLSPGAPRALVVLEKVGVTPQRYPRRPGMPAKRPL